MSKDYSEFSDEELILMLRDGEVAITDFIMEKYKNLVRSKAKSMYILGADSEDLIQEGMIGLFKAVRDYDCGRDANFYTFAELCISRQIYTAIRASGRQKHAPLNGYVSLYAGHRMEDESTPLLEMLASTTDINPEDWIIDQENVRRVEKAIEDKLSAFEKEVLDLYLTGMSYTQIAKVLGKDEKSTDNALSRLKQKLKKYIKLSH